MARTGGSSFFRNSPVKFQSYSVEWDKGGLFFFLCCDLPTTTCGVSLIEVMSSHKNIITHDEDVLFRREECYRTHIEESNHIYCAFDTGGWLTVFWNCLVWCCLKNVGTVCTRRRIGLKEGGNISHSPKNTGFIVRQSSPFDDFAFQPYYQTLCLDALSGRSVRTLSGTFQKMTILLMILNKYSNNSKQWKPRT